MYLRYSVYYIYINMSYLLHFKPNAQRMNNSVNAQLHKDASITSQHITGTLRTKYSLLNNFYDGLYAINFSPIKT